MVSENDIKRLLDYRKLAMRLGKDKLVPAATAKEFWELGIATVEDVVETGMIKLYDDVRLSHAALFDLMKVLAENDMFATCFSYTELAHDCSLEDFSAMLEEQQAGFSEQYSPELLLSDDERYLMLGDNLGMPGFGGTLMLFERGIWNLGQLSDCGMKRTLDGTPGLSSESTDRLLEGILSHSGLYERACQRDNVLSAVLFDKSWYLYEMANAL